MISTMSITMSSSILQLNTNGAIMVQGGLGYSIVIEGAVPFWDKEKIVYRPLEPELTASCVLAWKKQQPFSLAVSRFIEHCKCSLGITKYKNQVFDISK